MIPGGKGGAGFLASFGFAAKGVAGTLRTSRNFRVQAGIGVLAVVLCAAFRLAAVEWALVCACIGMVLGGECINSAIESVVDLASPDVHPLAKQAKDMAAGGVLVASVASLCVGIVLFAPRILTALGWL